MLLEVFSNLIMVLSSSAMPGYALPVALGYDLLSGSV